MADPPTGLVQKMIYGIFQPALARTDTKQFLQRLSAALRDDGRFVLESGAVAESILPNLVRSRWMQVSDILFLSSIDYDTPTSRLISRYVFIRGAEREEETAEVIVYTIGELSELFGEVGFAVESLFASPAKQPFHVGAPRLLLVARKIATPQGQRQGAFENCKQGIMVETVSPASRKRVQVSN